MPVRFAYRLLGPEVFVAAGSGGPTVGALWEERQEWEAKGRLDCRRAAAGLRTSRRSESEGS
jgi:hypothetical protein